MFNMEKFEGLLIRLGRTTKTNVAKDVRRTVMRSWRFSSGAKRPAGGDEPRKRKANE